MPTRFFSNEVEACHEFRDKNARNDSLTRREMARQYKTMIPVP
jgi:hypothetical protein